MNANAAMESVQWTPSEQQPCDSSIPHGTHAGVLQLAGEDIRVYRLSDGKTVVHKDDFLKFLFSGASA